MRCRSMLATGSRSPFTAETIDISSAGVGLLVDVQMRAGTPLTVELRFDQPKLDLSLDGVVMHAARMNGRWFAGVRFVGLQLAEELELSRFVLNEDRLHRANHTETAEEHAYGATAAAAVADGRRARGFHPHRLAAAS